MSGTFEPGMLAAADQELAALNGFLMHTAREAAGFERESTGALDNVMNLARHLEQAIGARTRHPWMITAAAVRLLGAHLPPEEPS